MGQPTSDLWDITWHMGSHSRLPPDTGERAPPDPSQKGWYSIYLSGGIEGSVDLGYIPRWLTHLQTVTHASINRCLEM